MPGRYGTGEDPAEGGSSSHASKCCGLIDRRIEPAGAHWMAVGKAEVRHRRRRSPSYFAEGESHRLMCQPPCRERSGPEQPRSQTTLSSNRARLYTASVIVNWASRESRRRYVAVRTRHTRQRIRVQIAVEWQETDGLPMQRPRQAAWEGQPWKGVPWSPDPFNCRASAPADSPNRCCRPAHRRYTASHWLM